MKLKAVLLSICLVLSMFSFAQKVEGDGGTRDGNTPVSANPGNGSGPGARGGVLWDQTGTSSNGFPAQNFETSFDAYDCMGAEDFTVPAGVSWAVDGVYFQNTLSLGIAPPDADIAFLADNSGAPGAVIASFTGVPVTYDGTGTSASLPVTTLAPGTYWVSLAVNMNFGTSGQFFWSNANIGPTLAAAHWKNPNNGFGNGCIDWTPVPTCGVGGGQPEAFFQILGNEVSCDITGFSFNGVDAVTIVGNCPDGIGLYANTPGGIVVIDASVVVSGSTTVDVPFFADSYYYLSDDGGATVFNGFRSGITVPTLGEWGMVAFLGLLMFAGLYFMKRRSVFS